MKSRTLILINLLMFSGVIAASTPASVATTATIATVREAAASPGWVVAPSSAKLVQVVAVRAASIAPLDYLLVFLVIAGLVTVQLRRTQDVAQRAFLGH